MKTLSTQEFRQWMSNHSIGSHPGYANSFHLTFLPPEKQERFWKIPESAEKRTQFLEALELCLPAGVGCWLFPPVGVWIDSQFPKMATLSQVQALLRIIGQTDRYHGALYFERNEFGSLNAFLVQDMRAPSDLTLIPESANFVVYFEHHGVVWIQTLTALEMQAIVDILNVKGFPLPEDYPDDTFKPVAWIKKPGT